MENVVLVTGSSRGIGAVTATLLASKGYRVAINYRTNVLAAEKVAADIRSQGGTCLAIKADVSIESDVQQLFSTIDSSLGTITHLVNNAGILLPQMPLIEMNAERINKILTTNVTSYFLCAKEAIKRMTSGGAIVNVSSGAARTGSPNEYIDYAASKGAIDTLTKGLSVELASKGIRVNGVRPGCIYTQMHADGGEHDRVKRLASAIPLGRGGEPLEVAHAIEWLLSDASSFTTGSIIDVTGGV